MDRRVHRLIREAVMTIARRTLFGMLLPQKSGGLVPPGLEITTETRRPRRVKVVCLDCVRVERGEPEELSFGSETSIGRRMPYCWKSRTHLPARMCG
jgi:hypothetical protein